MDDVARRNRLRATFDGVAERYDAVRPTYPQAVVDDLVALSGIEPGRADRVLETGCGTGQLTVDLARRGLDVTAVELGPALAAVARRNPPFPNARVAVGAFEEYAVAEPDDAVVAATSFHWIAPEVRLTRTAAALRPGGALAVVEVRPSQAAPSLLRRRQQCIGASTPPPRPIPPARRGDDPAGVPGNSTRHRCSARCSGAVTSGSSPTPRRPTARCCSPTRTTSRCPTHLREGLLDCIDALIDARYGGTVTKRYLAELVVAPRR